MLKKSRREIAKQALYGWRMIQGLWLGSQLSPMVRSCLFWKSTDKETFFSISLRWSFYRSIFAVGNMMSISWVYQEYQTARQVENRFSNPGTLAGTRVTLKSCVLHRFFCLVVWGKWLYFYCELHLDGFLQCKVATRANSKTGPQKNILCALAMVLVVFRPRRFGVQSCPG